MPRFTCMSKPAYCRDLSTVLVFVVCMFGGALADIRELLANDNEALTARSDNSIFDANDCKMCMLASSTGGADRVEYTPLLAYHAHRAMTAAPQQAGRIRPLPAGRMAVTDACRYASGEGLHSGG